MATPVSSTHTGWFHDRENSRLEYYFQGTKVGHINASGFTITDGTTPRMTDGLISPSALDTLTNVNASGRLELIYRVDVAASTGADTDITVAHKVRVVDAWAVHTGAAGTSGGTLTVKSTGGDISDAMVWSGADKVIVRAGTIDDAYHILSSGEILRVTLGGPSTTASGAGICYVRAVRST